MSRRCPSRCLPRSSDQASLCVSLSLCLPLLARPRPTILVSQKIHKLQQTACRGSYNMCRYKLQRTQRYTQIRSCTAIHRHTIHTHIHTLAQLHKMAARLSHKSCTAVGDKSHKSSSEMTIIHTHRETDSCYFRYMSLSLSLSLPFSLLLSLALSLPAGACATCLFVI